MEMMKVCVLAEIKVKRMNQNEKKGMKRKRQRSHNEKSFTIKNKEANACKDVTLTH